MNKNKYIIPLHSPILSNKEKKYLNSCLETGWISSSGKFVDLFEKKISEYTNSKNSVALVNGTAALDLSLKLAEIKPNDEIIVSTLTFIAPINAISYNLAKPIFMDVDEFFNIDVDKTIDFLKKETFFRNGFTFNKKTKKRIKALIAVHIFGNAVKIDSLVKECKKRNIFLIEDAAESLGTVYKKGKFNKKHVGTIGSIGCLSFNGNKIISTGAGGMLLTNSDRIAEKARYLSTQSKDDSIRSIHNSIGYNYRMSNINAAIGIGQLESLVKFLNIKKKIHIQYTNKFKNLNNFELIKAPSYANNNYWLNILKINFLYFNKSRDGLINYLHEKGIQVRPIWQLNHLQKPYKKCQTYKIEKAVIYLNNCICLPSSASLKSREINKIYKEIYSFICEN